MITVTKKPHGGGTMITVKADSIQEIREEEERIYRRYHPSAYGTTYLGINEDSMGWIANYKIYSCE